MAELADRGRASAPRAEAAEARATAAEARAAAAERPLYAGWPWVAAAEQHALRTIQLMAHRSETLLTQLTPLAARLTQSVAQRARLGQSTSDLSRAVRAVSLRAVAERILSRELGSVAAEVSAAAAGGRLQAARLGLARLQRHSELAEVWCQLDEVADGAPLRLVRHAHDADEVARIVDAVCAAPATAPSNGQRYRGAAQPPPAALATR